MCAALAGWLVPGFVLLFSFSFLFNALGFKTATAPACEDFFVIT